MNHQLRATSSELWATTQAISYELWASSYELLDTSYELGAKICDTQKPACAGWWQYGTVPGRRMIVRCRIVPYIDKIQLCRLMIVRYRCCTVRSSAGTSYISKIIVLRSLFAGFCELDRQVNSIVVKMLKPVLCFSHDGVPLKFKKKTCRHYSLTVRVVSAWFQPLLNLAGQYL